MPARNRRRRLLLLTAVLAFAAFCFVQDRVTAAGARRYEALQRAALAGRGPAVTIEEVMAPAIRRSVVDGLLASAGIGIAGVLVARRIPRG
jgi:hypothetical protein